jgi:hypothetical protein
MDPKQNVRMQTGFIWLRLGLCGGLAFVNTVKNINCGLLSCGIM